MSRSLIIFWPVEQLSDSEILFCIKYFKSFDYYIIFFSVC